MRTLSISITLCICAVRAASPGAGGRSQIQFFYVSSGARWSRIARCSVLLGDTVSARQALERVGAHKYSFLIVSSDSQVEPDCAVQRAAG